MAIATYAQLKTAIATWTVRSDLTSRLADIVAMTEADIRKDVRCQAMETLATGTLTGETLAFPTGFIWAKRLKVSTYIHEYVTPADYSDLTEAGNTEAFFTIIGTDIYINDGASGDSYSLIYHKAFAALSDDADTNWLLTNHPDVYLWGACAKVAIVTKDEAALAKYMGLYRDAVRRVNGSEWMAAASGSPLRVSNSTAVV